MAKKVNHKERGDKMKKRVTLLSIFAVFMLVGLMAWAAEEGMFNGAVGDKVYVCACGPGCGCNTISNNPGTCPCGNDLTEGTIEKIENGMATVAIGDKTQEFNLKGKYACACGAGCNCNTISQNPGNCACGRPMKMVE